MARVLVSMSENFLEKVDKIANNEGRTRSELVREALRVYFKRNQINVSNKANKDAQYLNEILE